MNKYDRPPTLKTIAALTGFSVTTVSRSLKDAPDIGTETKDRVNLVAKKIGYRPSRAGVRLRTGKTQVIALILDVDEKFMGLTAQMVSGISAHLKGSNYHLVVTPYVHQEGSLEPVKYVVETGSADAVIISRTEPNDARVQYLQDNNMPFVTHGRTQSGSPHAWVDYDNERFAYCGMQRFKALGAQNIATLFPFPHLNFWQNLQDGFLRGLDEFNMSDMSPDNVFLENSMEEVEDAFLALMRSSNRPDGVLCAGGSETIAIVSAIERAGLEVGKDVQLVAKQSTPILERFRPSINVFFEDVSQSGWLLCDYALKLIEGHDPASLNTLLFNDYEPQKQR